ncbi:hypothetical protein PUN28_009762 [Cardiocondyla obscurior]|uniref:Uncharacterized protein n=1 Tax=Cardiocondyla obscurior TaxID=286306 RepID=A0AAW2FKP1_9HYME
MTLFNPFNVIMIFYKTFSAFNLLQIEEKEILNFYNKHEIPESKTVETEENNKEYLQKKQLKQDSDKVTSIRQLRRWEDYLEAGGLVHWINYAKFQIIHLTISLKQLKTDLLFTILILLNELLSRKQNIAPYFRASVK